jgi:hypothetical protein
MGDSKEATPALCAALKTEKDPEQISMLASCLAQSSMQSGRQPDPGVADAILGAINEHPKDKQVRQTLLWSLQQMPGDEATRALATLAAAETDPAQKAGLESALKVRACPVAGFYISAVTTGSDAETAGLKAGDVITTIADKPVKSWRSLQGSGDEGTTVTATIWRDGGTFTVQLKGGTSVWQLGAQGDIAKGTATASAR